MPRSRAQSIGPKGSARALRVGKHAPDFTASAVVESGEISSLTLSDFRGRHVVLFFYPLGLPSVSPFKLLTFDRRFEDFSRRNVAVIGCSTDSVFTNFAWCNPRVKRGGVGAVKFPLVADVTHVIFDAYDVALQGSFVIDSSGILRHKIVDYFDSGSEVDELLSSIDALPVGSTRPCHGRPFDSRIQPCDARYAPLSVDSASRQ